jgi:hypothetical protein
VPPVTVTVILASLPGTQVGIVLVALVIVNGAAGCVKVMVTDFVHALASVTTQV